MESLSNTFTIRKQDVAIKKINGYLILFIILILKWLANNIAGVDKCLHANQLHFSQINNLTPTDHIKV